ncbi:MAG: pyrroline-5-carboxylate reductase, partial [Oscillospiraceae bacterium]|nr:pyrroline-5-carboxylate reductase [Oscillospiraceae bacterium]
PAFVCMFVEAMMDAGIRCGLTRDLAKLLSLQTVAGTARLALGSDKDPAVLRGEVCSPAGSTIEGVAALEANGFRSALLDAVEAAYQRTLELKG